VSGGISFKINETLIEVGEEIIMVVAMMEVDVRLLRKHLKNWHSNAIVILEIDIKDVVLVADLIAGMMGDVLVVVEI
jgi:hypothetical protein